MQIRIRGVAKSLESVHVAWRRGFRSSVRAPGRDASRRHVAAIPENCVSRRIRTMGNVPRHVLKDGPAQAMARGRHCPKLSRGIYHRPSLRGLPRRAPKGGVTAARPDVVQMAGINVLKRTTLTRSAREVVQQAQIYMMSMDRAGAARCSALRHLVGPQSPGRSEKRYQRG